LHDPTATKYYSLSLHDALPISDVLKDKVAIITGGTNGIGESVAKRFIQEGAKVTILGRSVSKLDKLQEELGDNLLAIQGDVASLQSQKECVEKTVNTFGKLDIYISNAGVFDGYVSLQQLPEDNIDEAFSTIFDTNVKG